MDMKTYTYAFIGGALSVAIVAIGASLLKRVAATAS